MIYCKETGGSFQTKEELFKKLREIKKETIKLKKSQVYKAYEKDRSICVYTSSKSVSKLCDVDKSIIDQDKYYYVAVNSTNILDSHDDLHVNGIWNKTIKDQKGKLYLVDTHKLSLLTTIVRKEDVIPMVIDDIPFSSIGKNYEGNTQLLVYKFKKEDVINQVAKDWLESGADVEGSVKMRYVNVELAMNSPYKEDVNELKNFNQYVDTIANKQEVEEQFGEIHYFWVVTEAQNVNESSLVLFGSNNVTGQIKEPLNEPLSALKKPLNTLKKDTLKKRRILI